MPTLIDELVVALGLDSSKFRTDADRAAAVLTRVGRQAVDESKKLEDSLRKQQDATDKRLRQTAETGRSSSQQFARFRGEVTTLFAALAGGFGLSKFVQGMANTEAATGRLAKNIGMSTRELNAWQEAAKRNGGSAEATGQSFAGLTQQFQQFAMTGNSAVLPYFRALGVQMSTAEGEMRPMKDIMLELADKFQNMTPQRANAFGAAIGLDEGTITLLRQGRGAVEEYLAAARKIGVISEEDARKGIEFQQKLNDLEQSFRNLGRAIANDLMPIFNEYAKDVTDWLAKPENKEFVAKEVHEDIEKFANGVRMIIKTITEWQTLMEVIAGVVVTRWALAMTVGLGPVGIAFAAIAASIVAIKKGMEGFGLDELAPDSPLWQGISREEQLKHPQSPEARAAAGKAGENPNTYHWYNPGSWLNHSDAATADNTMDRTKQGFLKTLSGPESGGNYNIKNGGSQFDDYSKFPEGIGPKGTSTASGRYQFVEGTWREQAAKHGYKDFSPATQDKAAWTYAEEVYRAKTGADLHADLEAGKTAKVAAALKEIWPSLPGGSQSHQNQAQFDENYARNSAGQFTWSKGAKENLVDPVKDFFNKHFGGSAPTPAPAPVRATPQPNTNPPDLLGLQRGLTPGSLAGGPASPVGAGDVTNHSEVHIGEIHVLSAGGDPRSVGKSVSDEIRRYSYVPQANTGLV